MKQAISIGKTVQFHTAEDVIAAYEAMDIPAYALINGKQLLHAYEEDSMEEGSQQLTTFLDWLKKSAGKYTLVVYKHVPPDGITISTPYSRSFNFMLNEAPATYGGDNYERGGGNYSYILKELEASRAKCEKLQVELDELEAEYEELENELEQKGKGVMGSVTKMLNNPSTQEMILGRLLGLLSPSADPVRSAALGAIPGTWRDVVTAEDLALIDQSLTVLVTSRTDTAELVSKLAKLWQVQPDTFDQYMGLFKSMPL